MEIGIGYPHVTPVGRSDFILEWAMRADAGPFSSLDTVDRLVYGNHEALITLAAAAAVTKRIRLMTAIVIAPLRGAARRCWPNRLPASTPCPGDAWCWVWVSGRAPMTFAPPPPR